MDAIETPRGVNGAKSRYRLDRGPFPEHPEIQQVVPIDPIPRLFESGSAWLSQPRATVSMESPKVVLFDLRHGEIADTEAAGIVESLADVGTATWLWLNHRPEPLLLSAMERGRDLVRATVLLATTNERIQKALDPHGDSPTERVDAIATLLRSSVRTDVALEPLLPGVTDTRESFSLAVDAIARAGAKQITVGYLTLPESDRSRIEDALLHLGVLDVVMEAFVDGPLVKERGESIRLLPQARRHRGYALLMSVAVDRGITVRVSSLSNPDFRRTRREAAPAERSLQAAFRSRVRRPTSS